MYVLDSGIPQTWQHVYTAVTRGQSRVYVITQKNGLENAIRRHVIKRNTRLEGLVSELIHNLGIPKNDFLSQLSQFQLNTPKRGSGCQHFKSEHEASSSPGPFQTYSGFGDLGLPKSATPSPCKRERTVDDCTTPPKQMKVRIL